MYRFVTSSLMLIAAIMLGLSLAQGHLFTALVYLIIGFICYRKLEQATFKD